jgi:integral membrane protein
VSNILQKIEGIQPFSETEAWNLFRLMAISEAVGWSLLISGILFKHFVTPANNTPVLVAGQIHGTIFLAYIVAVVFTYTSLRWSRKRTLIAGLASIPPYGTLVFEQWAAYKRRGEALKSYRQITVRAIIIDKNKVLFVQPADSGFWLLPGGKAGPKETAEEALKRLTKAHTGIPPLIDRLVYILQYRSKSVEHLEMFFSLSNRSDYNEKKLKSWLKTLKNIDEISYLNPAGNEAILPEFLRSEPLANIAKNPSKSVKFLQK